MHYMADCSACVLMFLSEHIFMIELDDRHYPVATSSARAELRHAVWCASHVRTLHLVDLQGLVLLAAVTHVCFRAH